jgi:hypothetical protein
MFPLPYHVTVFLEPIMCMVLITVKSSIFAPDKFAPDKFAPDKFAPDKFAPDKFAPDKFAPDKSAPYKSAPDFTACRNASFMFSASHSNSIESFSQDLICILFMFVWWFGISIVLQTLPATLRPGGDYAT